MQVLYLTHASVNAYLFQGLRTGIISGISQQTVLATAACSVLVFVQKIWFLALNWCYGFQMELSAAKQMQKFLSFVSMLLVLGSVYIVRKSKDAKKGECEAEDDFGKKAARNMWHAMFGYRNPPPSWLHYSLIYVAAVVLAFLTAWASCTFSFSVLAAWALERPTAIIALLDNFLRGLGLLPQLHISRKAGVVSPGLAVWIAMMGVIDIVELWDDGINLHTLCYAFGDIVSFVLVSDFMYLFVRSRLRGQSVVQLPDELQV